MRRWGVLAVALALFGLAPVVAPDARGATPTGLPVVRSGARPGPDVLYADPPAAPQLENRSGRFKAAPILVMGQDAYVDGEYLYQDWIYDDNGSDSGASDAGGTDTTGDWTYPTNADVYAGNAADLVELRIAPRKRDVAYRFTLNTLLDGSSTNVALGFDTDGDPTTTIGAADDSGVALPGADEVITTWGTGALLADAGGATPLTDSHVDVDANQITVVVPRTLSNPVGTWGASIVVGLRDAATGGWKLPGIQADAETPGGAGPLDSQPSGVFDLGLTFDEAPAGITPHDSKQAVAIRNKVAPARPIDFEDLRTRTNRTSVPASGTMGRIYPSRKNFGEGKDYDVTPEIHGQLQPYAIYVPTSYDGSTPAPLVLDLHSLGEHYWQYNGSVGVQQIGEQRGAIVIGCECRGEDGWYQHSAEYDVFEMWNDVARHFRLDPDRVGITGYSMGGYATYRLGGLYPDLFGKALSIVGPINGSIWLPPVTRDNATLSNIWIDNFRNLPIVNAAAGADELVPLAGTRAQNLGAPEIGIRGFDQLGYRYRYVLYPAAEHLTIGVLKYDLPYQKEFFGDSAVDRNPYHVTFRYLPASDDAELGLVHDHAYWVSGVRLASADGTLPTALVDAFSHASGTGDPTASEQTQTPGYGPLPYVAFERTWGDAPTIAVENRLTLALTNVGEVTIDLARARLHLDGLVLDVTTTTPAVVHLVDGDRVEDRAVSP